MANALSSRDQLDEAIERYRDVLRYDQRIYGEDNGFTITVLNNLAVATQRAGRLGESVQYLRQVTEARSRIGDESRDAITNLFNLASVLEKRGEFEESLSRFAQLFPRAENKIPKTHWLYGQFRKGYGTLLRRLERYGEAEVETLAGLEIMEKSLGKDHPRVVKVLEELVELYKAWGRPADAERYAARLKGK